MSLLPISRRVARIAATIALILAIAPFGRATHAAEPQVPQRPPVSARPDQPETRTVPDWVTAQPDFSATLVVSNPKLEKARGLSVRFSIQRRGSLYRLEALKPFPAWFECDRLVSGDMDFLCSGPFFLDVSGADVYLAHVPKAWLDTHRDREDDLGPLLFAVVPYPLIVGGIAIVAREERPTFKPAADVVVDRRNCSSVLISGSGLGVVYRVALDRTMGNLVTLTAIETMHSEGIVDYGDYSGLQGELESVHLGSPPASAMKIPEGYGVVELGD